MLHQETVEAGTLALIRRLSADPKLRDFVLVGGTALALQLGNGTRLKDYIDIHYLLEHRNLQQITAAYLAKYADANPSIAKNALLFHTEIRFKTDLGLTNNDLQWKDVQKRLREAVAEPKRTFQARETIRSRENKSEGLKRSKGLRKGNTP